MSGTAVLDARALGARAAALLRELAGFSERGPGVTRLYLTPEHAAALGWLERVMRGVGLAIRRDAVGTLIGRRDGDGRERRTLLLGSHVDTVREGGAFDGALGVIVPLVCLEALARAGARLPFPIEVVAFGDEEGVRFASTLGGSRALAGRFDPAPLEERDAAGVTLREALVAFGCDPAAIGAAARRPEDVLGFVELHIEQGPVLESEALPVGVVTAIAAAERWAVRVTGVAGHAGTVPMAQRRDALAGAAEIVLAAEREARDRPPAVATVGRLDTLPGAVNVIPGEVRLSLDVRAPDAAGRDAAVAAIATAIDAIAARRGVGVELTRGHAEPGAAMDPELSTRLAAAVRALGWPVRELPSGAGHDAMVMAGLTPTAMLFVRCRGGLSHHPDEHVDEADLGVAAAVLLRFLVDLAGG